MTSKSLNVKCNSFKVSALFAAVSVFSPVYGASFSEIHQCYANKRSAGSSIQITKGNQVLYSGAIGLANVSTGEQLDQDSVLDIGSITKTYTAVAVLLLSEEKKVNLEAPLGTYVKSIPDGYKHATVAQILSHIAGFPDYLSDSRVWGLWHRDRGLDRVVKSITRRRPYQEPLNSYEYSNTGYILLGKLIEEVSGLSYREFLEQRIFEPFGLKNTYVFEQPSQHKTVGYFSDPKVPEKLYHPEKVSRTWMHAAGAISSTVSDLSQFFMMLNTGKILSESSYQRMVKKAKLSDGTEVDYGLGVNISEIIGVPTIYHEGRVPGYTSWSAYFKDLGINVVGLSNNEGIHPGPATLHMVAEYTKLLPARISLVADKPAEIALLGHYQKTDGERFEIKRSGTDLILIEEGGEEVIELRENNSYSHKCSGNFFTLEQSGGEAVLTFTDLYRGERTYAKRVSKQGAQAGS
ncbi:serine hydrolase domain-containing protein [Pseudoalteromonas luteoviolacea]|uniref:serine hydrolase domain-containing protein n=1 Tax=Pseudoalteromonas luteoviolacea TaxID=43657 RepID=UPI001B364341|nr:serine hydrolase domain-containing protein [Pseudoalteromonas luteoviolacea]MBQ4836002.1 beta-lactamase family protein [Pseudoalteromonas luteoviolacea]